MPEPTRDYPPGGTRTASRVPAGATRSVGNETGDPGGSPGASTPLTPPGYELLEEIGRGGMGIVYRARDTAFDRDVAVKVLRPDFPGTGAAAGRFVNEARITGQLQHPGIPPVHQVGTLPDGRPFLAMKLIKGRTLDDLVRGGEARGRLLAAFEQLCQAVAYAQSRDVIHRDLKPGNVMVGAFGEVQVMDWGLAKVLGVEAAAARPATDGRGTEVRSFRADGSETAAGSVLGTPAFMPPEQASGEVARIDRRTDVFALGGVLCFILTGQPPYTGTDTQDVHLKAVRGQLAEAFARLDACGADPEWVALARRCLSAEPAARPANAGEAAEAASGLRTAAEERARKAEADRAAADARTGEQRKRRKVQLALLAAVAAALLVSVGAGWVIANERQARRLEAVRMVSEAAGRAELACEQARSRRPSAGTESAAQEAVLAWERADDAVERAEAAAGQGAAVATPDVTERLASLRRETAERLAGARQELGRVRERERLLREADRLSAEDQSARAAELAREAARLDPTSPWSHLDLGDLLAGLGNYDDAREAYKKAQTVAQEKSLPSADAQTFMPFAYHRPVFQKRVRLRLERLDRYARLEPALTAHLRDGSVPAERDDRLILAEVCFLRGYYARSAKLYQAALPGKPPEPGAEKDPEARAVRAYPVPFAVRAYLFAGCGLGKDRGELDEVGRAEFRAAAWKLSGMGHYDFAPPPKTIGIVGEYDDMGSPKNATEAGQTLDRYLQDRGDRLHRMVFHPGPCFPHLKGVGPPRLGPEESADCRAVVFAYTRWITRQLIGMEPALGVLALPLDGASVSAPGDGDDADLIID